MIVSVGNQPVASPNQASAALHRAIEANQTIAMRIVRQGQPQTLMQELEGQVWTKVVDKADIPTLRDRYELISTRLSGGRTVVHVLSPADPGDGFAPHRGGLEDVYFASLHAARQDAARAARAKAA